MLVAIARDSMRVRKAMAALLHSGWSVRAALCDYLTIWPQKHKSTKVLAPASQLPPD
jgi:hypothetical protein